MMVVSNRYDPDPRVHKEALALTGAGHSVRVLAFDRQHELNKGIEIIDGVEIERIRLQQKVPYGGLLSTARGLRGFRKIVRQRLMDKPADVVHCHDQDTCDVGRWWQRLGRGKFVFDAHDLYWTWLRLPNPDSIMRRLGAVILKRRDRRYARYADMMIVGTEGDGDFTGFYELYREEGVDSVVIMNAVDEPDTVPSPPDEFTVGYFGSLRDLQMFHNLIEAICGIEDDGLRPRLRVAGAGTEFSNVSELLRNAKSKGLEYDISGRFSESDLPSLMAECSIQYCVYSMKRGNIVHTIPAKLFTSLAYNRRCIVNDNSLYGNLTKKNKWGWCIDDGDIDGLRELLVRLASEWKEVRNETVPWGEFDAPPSWDAEARKLVIAYGDLLE